MTTNMILTLLSTDLIAQHTAAGHWRDRTIYMEAAEQALRAPSRVCCARPVPPPHLPRADRRR